MSVFRRQGARIALSLGLSLAFLLQAAGVFQWGLLSRLESIAYDTRLLLTMPGGIDPRVVILDIDERSLALEGRFPWPRDRLAKLVDRLFDDYGVALLGMDIVFAEPDESSGLPVLEDLAREDLKDDKAFSRALESLRPKLDRDRIFAQSMAGRPVVLGYYFDFKPPPKGTEAHSSGVLPAPALELSELPAGARVYARRAYSYGANLPELQRNARGGGHFIPVVDEDGVVRRVPMLVEYQGGLYEALSLAMARVLLGGEPLRLGFAEGAGAHEGYPPLEWLALGGRHIPVDEHVNALVPFRGAGGSFPYVSASDVLRGQADPNVLRDAVVILGTSAPGLMDLRSTPVQSVYPGVEIHANLLAGILDGHFKQQPAYTVGVNFLLLLVLGVLLSFTLPLLGPTWVTLVTLGMLVAVGALNLLAWQFGDLVLPIAPALLLVFSLFVFNAAYGFFVESRSKRLIARRFGEYVPPELVSEMSKDPKRFTLEGESRQMTILFSDIRGFTTIAESLNPRNLSQLMSDFLTPMTRVIHAHRGTIDKYMGDAIMAFWGAPLRDEDHARHALQAGLQMLEELRSLQPHFEERGWPPVRIGVGINTGMMSVGNMGSEFRMAYTVLGDAVNLGSRLEGLTRQYQVDIIVSETTRNSLPEHVFRQLDLVRVKGKLQPVAIFEPLGPAAAQEPHILEDIAQFHSALESYRARDWDKADAILAQLAARSSDYYPYQMYRERIAYFKQNPPPADWDGVFVFKSK